MALHKDCTTKTYPPNTDLSSRLIPMHAHDLKNGMWCLDDKSGLPGTVSELKMSKTGKHGHAKFTYKLRMPHSGRSSSLMHPGGDHLYRPVMEKVEYLVSHMDGDGMFTSSFPFIHLMTTLIFREISIPRICAINNIT